MTIATLHNPDAFYFPPTCIYPPYRAVEFLQFHKRRRLALESQPANALLRRRHNPCPLGSLVWVIERAKSPQAGWNRHGKAEKPRDIWTSTGGTTWVTWAGTLGGHGARDKNGGACALLLAVQVLPPPQDSLPRHLNNRVPR